MAEAPAPITSPPPVPGQPWDATSEATISKWKPVNPQSGPASMSTGMATGEFEDGPAGWRQT